MHTEKILIQAARTLIRHMPSGHENDPSIEVHAGLAYSPDGSLLYVATGDSGKIRAYRSSDWAPASEVSLVGTLGGKSFSGSFAATLAVSTDGGTLYALDQGNWRIVILDASSWERIGSVPTGRFHSCKSAVREAKDKRRSCHPSWRR